MNIATNKLSAPIEKQASIYDAALEYLGSGGLTKLLPQGFAGNHALAAGTGALGSDVTRRILRSRGLGDASSSALGSLVGLGLGGAQGGAGALAALHPAVRSRTAGTGLKNILGTTAFFSGGEHLGKMIADVNPAALVNDAAGGMSKLVSPLTPHVSGTPALVTGDGVGQLAKSVGAKGIGEVTALKNELASRLGELGSAAKGELSNTDLYKTLGSAGLGAGALGGGLHTLKPDWLKKLTEYAGKTPRAAAMGLGGLGLAAAGAPILGAGTALAGLAAAGPTRDAVKYLYKNAPGGTIPGLLGGGTALLGAPVVGTGLGFGALAANPLFRSGAIGAGQLAGKGIVEGGKLTGKGIVGGGKLVGKGYKALPKGSILGGAGLAATIGGMPLYGVPAMLAAPFYNPRSSRFIGDVARELRAPVVKAREAQKTKEVIDGLYKKSSYSIKLAAPVYRTQAYCLDAPTMDKVAFLPQMMEAGTKFLGKSQRALFGGNKVKLLDRSAKALQQGALDSGKILTPAQARSQAEAFFRQEAKLDKVVARNAPKAGTRAAYADIGTQYEGTADILQQQLDQGTQGWKGWIPFRNRRIRNQNMRNIEARMREYGLKGTAPSPLTASTDASTAAQKQLDAVQQAANEAGLFQRDASGKILRDSTGKPILGEEGKAIHAKKDLRKEVTRLTAPVEQAQQQLTAAEQAAQQSRQNYFKTNFGIDAPTQTLDQLEARLSKLQTDQAYNSYRPMRLRKVDPKEIETLNKQIEALKATEKAQAFPTQKGLNEKAVTNYLSQDSTQLEQSYRQLQQAIANRGVRGPTQSQKNQLDLLKEYMELTPGATTREVAAAGSPELTSAFNALSGNQRSVLKLKRTATPDQIQQAFTSEITRLEGLGRPLNQRETDLLNKLKAAEVDVAGPAEFKFIGEQEAGLRTRLQEMQQNLQRQKEYTAVTAAEGYIEPLRPPLQQAQEALTPAEEALSKAQYELGTARLNARGAAAHVPTSQARLDASLASEQATQNLLNAPVANTVTSKLDAPVLKTVAEGGAKPEVVEVLSARGMEGIAPGMEEQLRLLEAAGQDTGKLVNSAAKRTGLPKAVKQVNKAADQLVNEAVAGLSLSPQELEAVQNAVRQMSSKGEQLTESALTALLGRPNAQTQAAFIEIERLVGLPGKAARQYTEASTKLTDSFNRFGRELGTEFSAAQEVAANASYSGMRKGVQSATEQPGFFKRLFTGRGKGLAAEDVEAIEAVEALTSARVQAIETAIAGQGGNAALAQAARPQLYAASEAVARSSDPQLARAWARALQEPGSLAKSIEGNTKLKLLIEKEAPELLNANNKAFTLSVEQAEGLQGIIPRTGRGGSAESIVKEVELGLNPETFRDIASPRAQEALGAMNSANAQFGGRMENLVTSDIPAQNSALNKVLAGTDDAAKLTFEEVAGLKGVDDITLNASRFTTDLSRITAANKELAAIKPNSTIEDALAYFDKELKGLKDPRGGAVNPRRGALEDARDTIVSQLQTSRRQFTSEYSKHMRTARRNLETTIKQDSRVDLSQLRRNTDVAKVKVERSTMDKLYQQPIVDESGNLVFNQADLTKQLEHLTSLRANANVPKEVLQARVIEENLARLKDAGADQQLLNNARANLESMFQVSSVDAIAQGGGRGGGGMFAGLATVGAAGVGGGVMSNRGPGPATQARQQVRASWGLSPLHAPVIQSKLAAAVKPIPLKATQPKLPKIDKLPAQSLLTATVEGQEQAMKMSSLLAAPVRGSYYGHV